MELPRNDGYSEHESIYQGTTYDAFPPLEKCPWPIAQVDAMPRGNPKVPPLLIKINLHETTIEIKDQSVSLPNDILAPIIQILAQLNVKYIQTVRRHVDLTQLLGPVLGERIFIQELKNSHDNDGR